MSITLCTKVEEHYIRAIEIYEMSFGASDTNVAKTKSNLVRFTRGVMLCSFCGLLVDFACLCFFNFIFYFFCSG